MQGPYARMQGTVRSSAALAVQEQLGADERLFAFLDDIHVTSSPNRLVPIFNILRRECARTNPDPLREDSNLEPSR